MGNLDFVKKLYNGKNCYSDHMDNRELNLLHIESNVETIITDMLENNKIVLLTGNPGDGKTFIIKAVGEIIEKTKAYTQTDLNNVTDYSDVAEKLLYCYNESKPAILAVNEYPFIQLCKKLKTISPEIYNEIVNIKKNIITYDISSALKGRIAIIDLNERNLLASDRELISDLLDKFITLLAEDSIYYKTLSYNISALSIKSIKKQIISIFKLVAVGCEHFAVRDILGAMSFILTACTTDEYADAPYYTTIFSGTNILLQTLKIFDPIYLSIPSLDEQLWNGEINSGWRLGVPEKWPNSSDFDDDIDGAVNCFMNVKRKYYFENVGGEELRKMQPNEVQKCTDIFIQFETKRKKIKEKLIRSINKLFLPSSDEKKQLRIWTTHHYDISQETAVAISSKSVYSSELDILMPRPADWLVGLEYVPNHIVLKPKQMDKPRLILDVDFLQTLELIENGYPIGLLASQYEQAATMFLQKLDDNGLAEENDNGEIIIASRKKNYKKSITIVDGKYDFEEGDF